MSETILRGVSCPTCAGSLEVAEGTTLLDCQFCGSGLMVLGDRGLPRHYVPVKITKEQIQEKIESWFRKIDKAPDLRREGKITEMFLVFVPFWRVNAKVIGWVLGDVKQGSGKNKTYKPVERHVNQDYEFTAPACDIGELGVKWVDLKGDEIRPFQLETVQAQGMTFGIMTTPTDAINLCDQKFIEWGEKSARVDRITFRRLHKIGSSCNLVYYPLWVTRYEYRNRIYQITADAESGDLLYGRAPGNNLYRVAWLMGSIFTGDFVMTTGLRGGMSDDAIGLLVLCFVIIAVGYRKYRHGGEIKIEQKDKMKPGLAAQLMDRQAVMQLFNEVKSLKR
jgi:hypothetical protein